jgi:hypothetical protein
VGECAEPIDLSKIFCYTEHRPGKQECPLVCRGTGRTSRARGCEISPLARKYSQQSDHPRSHRPHHSPRPRPRPAIEALGTIQPSGPFERALARLLIAAYKRRLRAIVRVVPTWVSEKMLSTSERGKATPLFDFCPELPYTMCV